MMKGPVIALCTALVAGAALGCGGAGLTPAVPEHDAPVPASEPRAEVRLRIDLQPEHGCEEAFDLALYADRGVDLVQWDANAGSCAGRLVTIRYLPRKLRAEDVRAAAAAHALKVSVLAEK